MTFYPRFPNGSLEIPKVRTLVTLGPYNFACRPLIEMKSVVALIKSFPMVCRTPSTCEEIELILDF